MTKPHSPADHPPQDAELLLAALLDNEAQAAPESFGALAKAATRPEWVARARAHAEVGDALRSLLPNTQARSVGNRVMLAMLKEPIHLPRASERRAQVAQARGFLRWGSLAAGVAAIGLLGTLVLEFSGSAPLPVARSVSQPTVNVSLSAPTAQRYLQAHGNGAAWLRIGAEPASRSAPAGEGR